MIQLLASVTTPEEAELALAGGADLIDLKDPSRGALGALPITEIRAIREHVGGRRPLSATIGDLPADPERIAQAIRETADAGVDLVKVGFFSQDHLEACLPVIADLAKEIRIVAVLFADSYSELTESAWFAAAGCAGLMLDTADKSGGNLVDRLALATLKRFADASKAQGLMTGLAGSLRQTDISRLAPLAPDYLGFRGALCQAGQRTQALSPERLRETRLALDRANAEANARQGRSETGLNQQA